MDVIEMLEGLNCWHVSAGGSTAPSFKLVLGEKVPRAVPLRNVAQPEVFRLHRGSVELLVWCSWRLQTEDTVLATSDQGPGWVESLARLINGTVSHVTCSAPAWDLRLKFVGDMELLVFCDHFDSESSTLENWELYSPAGVVRAGPGAKLDEQLAPASLDSSE